jgi:hypothetical protein
MATSHEIAQLREEIARLPARPSQGINRASMVGGLLSIELSMTCNADQSDAGLRDMSPKKGQM